MHAFGIRLAVALCLAWSAAALTGGARAQTPVPPRADRAVYDEAGVIDPARERAIEALNQELYRKAGVAIVVLTVPALEGETIDQLAVRVGHEWGIGGEGQDRGLVIAFAERDRRIFVATGYGTEGYLPDGRVGALIDEHAMPFLRAGRPAEGLLRLNAALAQASAAEYGVELTGSPGAARAPRRQAGPLDLVVGALLLLLFVYLAIRHPHLLLLLLVTRGLGGRGGGGFGGGGGGFGGGGGGFGGGGAGRSF